MDCRTLLHASLTAGVLLLSGCRSERTSPNVASRGDPPPIQVVSDPAPPAASTSTSAAPAVPASPGESLAAWLQPRMPAGGRVTTDGGGAVRVVHTVSAGDTALTVARAYLDLTSVYRAKDLAAEITKRVGGELAAGASVEIPHVLEAPYGTPEESRMRWPADRVMKGVFISGLFAGIYWPETLEKLATHGLNAVVLDAKDYMGTVNYPTKVRLAVELEAAKNPPIADYARAIRFAHARGIRVIARIPCFHDPWAAKRAPAISVLAVSGHPFEMGWLDPANPDAQSYLVDLVDEVIALGADEVQLDYVRFPVYSLGIKYAALPPADGHRSQAIKAFVRRVHDVTHAHDVPLSLDLFGVTATGIPSDIEALGQNIGVIGGEAEVLSPMLYPSHYAPGFLGFATPGDHPEIVGLGTKASIDKLAAATISDTLVRPWLQASAYKTPTYGPKYIEDEIRSAEAAGAIGWLFWDPDNDYWPVWRALPVVAPEPPDGGAVTRTPDPG